MNKNLSILFRSMFCGALFQLVFSVFFVDWLPLQKFGYPFYEMCLIFLPALLLIAISPLFFVAAATSEQVRQVLNPLVFFGCAVGIFLTISPAAFIGKKLRINEFHQLADRSEHLIAAINSFKQDKGELPNDLRQLIPQYLDKYPTTNMAAYPDYGYHKEESGESFSFNIPCGLGILNWDEFIYKSNEDYSEFSNSAEKLGRWIYFHE